ncbi:hypothetical protein Tco_0768694 [Tanacetum coccineum]
MTAIWEVNERVTDLSITQRGDTFARWLLLMSERLLRPVHAELLAYRAHVQIHKTHIQTHDARIGSLETLVVTLMAQNSSLQTQLTATLGRIHTLEARELAHTDDLEDVDSSG